MGSGASTGGGDFYSNIRKFNDECMSILDMVNPFQLGTSEAHWLGDRIESCSEYSNTIKSNSYICSPDGLFILYRTPDDMDFITTGFSIHLNSLKWIRLENFRVCADEEVTASSGLHILPTDHYGVRATKDGEKMPFKNSYDITELVRNELIDSKANDTVVFRFSGPFTPQMMSGNPDMRKKREKHEEKESEGKEDEEGKTFDEGVEQTFSALYFFENILDTHHKIHLYHSIMYMESIRLNKALKQIEKGNESLKAIKEAVNKYDTRSIHASFHSKRSDAGSKIISLLEGEGKEEMTELIRKIYQEQLLQPFHEGLQSNTFVELKRLSVLSADDAKEFVDLTKKNSVEEVMEKVSKLFENGGELKVAEKSVDRYLQLKLHDEGFEGEAYTAEYARRQKLIEINTINENEEFREEWVTMKDSDEDLLRFKQRRNIILKEQKDLNKKVLAHTDPEVSSEVNEFRNSLKKINKEIKAVVEETGNINDLTNWRKKDAVGKLLDGTDQLKQISVDDYTKLRSSGSQSANFKSELFHLNKKQQQKQQQIAAVIEEADEVFDQSAADARLFDMFDRFGGGGGGGRSGSGGSSIGKGGGGSITSDNIQMEGGSNSYRSSSIQIDGSFREPDFGIPSEGQTHNRSFHDIFHPQRNSSITSKNTNLDIDKYEDVLVEYFDDKSLSRSKLKLNQIDDKMSIIIDHEVSIVSKKNLSVGTYDNLNIEQYNEHFKNRSASMKNSSYAKRSLSKNTVKNQLRRVKVTNFFKSLGKMIKGDLIMMVVMGGITAGLTLAMNKIETVDMTVIKGGGKSMDSQTQNGAILQDDGNFVHYVKGKEADWSSNNDNTQYKGYMHQKPQGPFTLQVKNSREVVLYPTETPENVLWRMTVDGDQHKGFQLKSGGRLYKDNFLLSKDGRFKLYMHEFGNLVLYRIPFESAIKLNDKDLYQNACKNWGPCVFPLWSSNTDNISKGDPRMVLQDDGNMILESDEDIFHGSGTTAYFDSGSYNLPGAVGPYTLTLEDTGDVITRDKNQRIVMWISPSSSGDGRLSSGSILPSGGFLFSQNGKFVLRFENGMVAIYQVPSYRNPIFTCGYMTDKSVFDNGYMTTDGNHVNLTYPRANGLMVCPSTARLQIVGNYALKGADGNTKDVEVIAWQSELPSKLPSSTYLELTNDGYLTIKDSSDDSIIWMNWYRYTHTLLEEHNVQVLFGSDPSKNKAYNVDYALKDMTISNNYERMLRSPNGIYRLVLDRGHLIVYDGHDRPHFASLSPGEEAGAGADFWMETLGIMNKSPIYGLLYQARCAIGRAMDQDWSIKTDTGDDYYDKFWLANSLIPYSRRSYCVLQDDGNLVIYRPWEVNQKGNRVGGLFSSNSAGNTSKSDGPFRLALWDNGSLHIYDRHKKSIWSWELDQINSRSYLFDADYNGPRVQDDEVAKVLKYEGRLNLIRRSA